MGIEQECYVLEVSIHVCTIFGEFRSRNCVALWQGELSFMSDELIEGGQKGEMTNGKNYSEVRQCHDPFHMLRFYFVTRVYSPYMETVIADLVTGLKPNIVIINSCLWDITRYSSTRCILC